MFYKGGPLAGKEEEPREMAGIIADGAMVLVDVGTVLVNVGTVPAEGATVPVAGGKTPPDGAVNKGVAIMDPPMAIVAALMSPEW